jgi:hypothetical protein
MKALHGRSFFMGLRKATLTMKVYFAQGECAIKNNGDGVREGKPTILAASMCNEELVSQ